MTNLVNYCANKRSLKMYMMRNKTFKKYKRKNWKKNKEKLTNKLRDAKNNQKREN